MHDPNIPIVLSNQWASNILDLTARQLLGKDAKDLVWMFVCKDLSAIKFEDYPID